MKKYRYFLFFLVVVFFFVFFATISEIRRDYRLADEGNILVEKIETFRTIHGRLPDRLEEIGGKSKDGGGDSLFYHKRNDLQYVIWFGTTLGESIYFDSENGYWRDSARRGRMFPEKQQRYFKRLINDPYIFFSFILMLPTAIMVASFLGIPFYYMMERIFLIWKRKKGDTVVSTNSKYGDTSNAQSSQ